MERPGERPTPNPNPNPNPNPDPNPNPNQARLRDPNPNPDPDPNPNPNQASDPPRPSSHQPLGAASAASAGGAGPTGTASAPTLRGRAGYASGLAARPQGPGQGPPPAADGDEKLSRIHQQLDQLQGSLQQSISVRGEAHRGLQAAAATASTASAPHSTPHAAAPAAARSRTRTPTGLMWAGTQSFNEQSRSRGVSRQ